jgi:hypothetical protein
VSAAWVPCRLEGEGLSVQGCRVRVSVRVCEVLGHAVSCVCGCDRSQCALLVLLLLLQQQCPACCGRGQLWVSPVTPLAVVSSRKQVHHPE